MPLKLSKSYREKRDRSQPSEALSKKVAIRNGQTLLVAWLISGMISMAFYRRKSDWWKAAGKNWAHTLCDAVAIVQASSTLTAVIWTGLVPVKRWQIAGVFHQWEILHLFAKAIVKRERRDLPGISSQLPELEEWDKVRKVQLQTDVLEDQNRWAIHFSQEQTKSCTISNPKDNSMDIHSSSKSYNKRSKIKNNMTEIKSRRSLEKLGSWPRKPRIL